MVRAKIICTLGPASDKAGVLSKMVSAGMDVGRLNFSHGSLDEHLARIRWIRAINRRNRKHIKILGDLEGYRIRIGRLNRAIAVKKGQLVWLTTEKIVGRTNIIPFDYAGPLPPLQGQNIFIDDGNIHLVVVSVTPTKVKTKVVVGGIIKEHKGINIPDVRLDFSGLTDRDKKNIEFCLENKIDYLAQSFVRHQNDILDLKTYLTDRTHRFKIIAKIENREGIQNIDQIIKICDGIMVARGDMGVSIPIYEVPIVQKTIIKKCNRARKLVITATQMLESMTENYRPTRAEVSDVANAILDGTDFVMLSGETAIGAYPVETVAMMDKVIRFTQQHM